jgi:DNA-binding transcriptional LysR family regulator
MADQNRTDLDWEDVRIFIALARHGSLSAAARALSVNHATIARRVQ